MFSGILKAVRRNPFLFYIAAIASMSNGFVLPFLKQINVEITNSYTILCIGEALFIVSLAIMGVVWGIGFDKTNNKKLLMFLALECVAVFVFLTSIASKPSEYLILRLLTGFFLSAIYAYAMSIVVIEYVPGERINTYMLVYLFMNIGVGIGIAMGAFLSKVIDWRNIVRFYALLLGINSPAILLSDNPKQYADKNEWGLLVGLYQILSVRTNIIIMLQGFFGCIPWGAIGLFIVYALMEKTGGGFISVGAILALGGLFYPFSLAVAPRMDRMRERGEYIGITTITGMIILLQAILFVIFILLPLPKIQQTDNVISEMVSVARLLGNRQVLLSLIIYGLFIFVASIPGPVTRNIIADVNDQDKVATTVMMVRLMESLGNAFGLIIAGLIIDFYGRFISALEAIWVAWIICGGIWFLLGRYYQEDVVNG